MMAGLVAMDIVSNNPFACDIFGMFKIFVREVKVKEGIQISKHTFLAAHQGEQAFRVVGNKQAVIPCIPFNKAFLVGI